ncbi:MAG: cysteine dioxygenase family protein [Chloroflexi bacterium]|nr:cysteine dioxygenase family protein [Chloroflexota bacterium]
MTITKYALDEFIYDMNQLVDSQPDQEKLFDKGSSYLEKLILNPEGIPEELRTPSGKGPRPNHGTYLLHHNPENGLLITTVIWGPGDHTAPHDHKTWGMIGVMGNAITETRFQRKDDGSRENFAILEKGRVVTVKPGDVSLLIPDVDEIHQMDNLTDRPTPEVHVYGNDLRGLERCRFDLETGEIKSFSTTRFDNC